ncbi:uncharacterized protein LOC135211953 [Macrobrachium nipponense]|uniref:uncharacterized protein LOC135211953 n=1 Tax=Macrobrachium nipponense TaxID=159736 RepID=UPI0030C83585
MMIRGICLLATIACAVGQAPTETDTKSAMSLKILELRQVTRQDDPSGKNHNLKVIISPYDPLPRVTEWSLIFSGNDQVSTTYTTKADGQDPTSQTEFIFEGNLVEAGVISLIAKNATGMAASCLLILPITDLKSDVAWVGDYKSGKAASLRVTPGELVDEVMVDQQLCKYSQSPCYYITPKPHPTSFERCHFLIEGFKLCDDRVISYSEPSSLPAIFLKDNKFLEVEVTHKTGEVPVMEVVAYDPQDHNQVFTRFPYRCLFPVGSEWQDMDTIQCRAELTVPGNSTNMMVLVVTLDEEGDVVESSLQFYGDSSPLPPSSNTGVIVGAIFGTLIGLTIVVFMIICCMKKKDEKRAKTDRGGSAVYQTTTTTDPAEA